METCFIRIVMKWWDFYCIVRCSRSLFLYSGSAMCGWKNRICKFTCDSLFLYLHMAELEQKVRDAGFACSDLVNASVWTAWLNWNIRYICPVHLCLHKITAKQCKSC